MAQAAQVLSTGPEADTKADAKPFAERLREKSQKEQEAYDKKAAEIREEVTKFHALKEELNQAIMDQRGSEETAQLNEAFEEKAQYILRQQTELNQLYQNLAQVYDQVIKSVTEDK
jgi:phytoene dehydrogenase-like protein